MKVPVTLIFLFALCFPALGQKPVSGQLYRIESVLSGKALDVDCWTDDAASLQIWTYNGTSNQQFRLTQQGDYWAITDEQTGKVLDVKESLTSNGASIQQYANNHSDNQLWKITPDGDSFSIIAKNSGKVLDAIGGASATNDGTRLQQWDNLHNPNQHWRLIPVEAGPRGCALQLTRMTKIALASTHERFLQCHCDVGDDGELHASNPKINKEETWWIYQIGDPSNHQVALANYRNNYYLNRHSGGGQNHRAEVVHHDVDARFGTDTWTVVSGAAYGLPSDVVAFRANDGSYLKAWEAGHNADGERGELYVDMSGPQPNPAWNGWWRMGEVTWTPQDGRNFITGIGDGITAFLNGVGDSLSFVFGGSAPPNNGGNNGGAAPLSCSQLPAVRLSATVGRVHAYCEGVTPSDFRGPFYPENDPYLNRRVQCDIEAHHNDPSIPGAASHHVISQTCDIGMTNGTGCEGVD